MAGVGLLTGSAAPVLAAPGEPGEPAALSPAGDAAPGFDRLAVVGVWIVIALVTLVVLAKRGALSPRRLREGRSRDPAGAPASLWLGAGFGLFLLWRIGTASGVSLAAAAGEPTAGLGASAGAMWAGHALVLSAVGALVFSRRVRRGATRAGLVIAPRDGLVGLGALLLAAGPVLATLNLSALIRDALAGEPAGPVAHDFLAAMIREPGTPAWWAALAAVALATPIVEELIHRGLIQTGVLSATGSPALAVVVSAAFFASIHLGAADAAAIPGLFVFALGLGLAFERTGRLGVPIVMHALFNAGMVAAAHLTG